ncbi:MAG: hypothetical protein PHG85_07095, partial [Candidatus Altiarchaeota archaeon]|nr:hypothetical protein [Candidatus Altiarchaeota archaeon]
RSITLKFNVNNSTVYVCPANTNANLLFEKKSFTLRQYKVDWKESFKLDREEKSNLFIEVRDLNKKEIEDQKAKGNAETELKQSVIIRIAEKFDIERITGKTLLRLVV